MEGVTSVPAALAAFLSLAQEDGADAPEEDAVHRADPFFGGGRES